MITHKEITNREWGRLRKLVAKCDWQACLLNVHIKNWTYGYDPSGDISKKGAPLFAEFETRGEEIAQSTAELILKPFNTTTHRFAIIHNHAGRVYAQLRPIK